MAIWIEYRCENRTAPSSEGPPRPGERCFSHDNAGPMDMAGDTRADVLYVLSELDKEARRDGWKKTRDGWVCPYCAGQLSLK